MKIKCGKCGHIEETSLSFFVKIIGGALPFGGYWAWVTYLFAGTGFAMPIVIAIMAGGVTMLAFKDKIVEWIVNRGHKCPKCDAVQWEA
jgi:ribosomal protein S27AE